MIGNTIIRTKICDDSMAWAKKQVHTAPDGAVFIADTLRAAHGRDGRVWEVHDGQLLLTILLKPERIPMPLEYLNMALSVGIAQALSGVTLKWPNDFMLQGKKLGGMLIDVLWQGGQCTGIVVGIGLNINNEFGPSDTLFERAISLKAVTKKTYDLKELSQQIYQKLSAWYVTWQFGEQEQILQAWRFFQFSDPCLDVSHMLHFDYENYRDPHLCNKKQ